MKIGRLPWAVSLAAALALSTSTPRGAFADSVIADDQIVQGGLCVGPTCVDGEAFSLDGQITIKGPGPFLRFSDNSGEMRNWNLVGDALGFDVFDANTMNIVFSISPDTGANAFKIAPGGVGIGTSTPAQKLHVRQDQNANSFILVQNAVDGPGANAVVRTQADTAIQNFQSHASSRTLVRWGVALGGWNEFLSFIGDGLAMGTLGNAPFILGTSATARMTFAGGSNTIVFAGGGVYNGSSFLDASSRALKQDVRLLEPGAAAAALADLAPVTFAYRDAPEDPHVGFIAEDVPELVATPDRQTLSALEIVAVLTKVVQEQQKALAELTARLATLEARP